MNEQIDLFSYVMPKFKIDKPIRLIELFAGIGSQAKALKNLGVEFEHHFVCEIDAHAIKSYNAIHNTNFETKDITKVSASELNITERERYCYILTYSFPCQDLSLAGLGKGMAKGSSTRSGLLWEVERLLDECNGNLPQVLLMENVPQVIGKKNIKDFQEWRRKLESLGYSNYVQLLNAKNYGIPQNRNRCFMVSILGNYHYSFPKKMPLKLKLKDMLEDNVDEKYYLSDKQVQDIQKWNAYEKPLEQLEKTDKNNYSPTITTRTGEYTSSGNYSPSGHNASSVVDKNGLAPTVMENHGTVTAIVGGVMIKNNNSKGYELIENNLVDEGDMIYHSYTNNRLNGVRDINTTQNKDKNIGATLTTRPDTLGIVVNDMPRLVGGVGQMKSNNNTQYYQQDRIYDSEEIALCQSANESFNPWYKSGLRIRKLTPKECWRLMGFSDEDFEKAEKVNSNAQLYKQAGNSIVVNVLEAIFKEIL